MAEQTIWKVGMTHMWYPMVGNGWPWWWVVLWILKGSSGIVFMEGAGGVWSFEWYIVVLWKRCWKLSYCSWEGYNQLLEEKSLEYTRDGCWKLHQSIFKDRNRELALVNNGKRDILQENGLKHHCCSIFCCVLHEGQSVHLWALSQQALSFGNREEKSSNIFVPRSSFW